MDINCTFQIIEHLYLVGMASGKSQKERVLKARQKFTETGFCNIPYIFLNETAIDVGPLNVFFEISIELIDVHVFILGSLSFVQVTFHLDYIGTVD